MPKMPRRGCAKCLQSKPCAAFGCSNITEAVRECDGERAVLWPMAVTTKLPLGDVKTVYTKVDARKGRVVGVMEQPWLAGDEDGAQEAPSRVARVTLSAWVPMRDR
jgi:hypothetical protein